MSPHFLFDVFQFVVVTLLVLGASVYCLLTLAPNALKQLLKKALLRCPLPAFVAAKLRQPSASGACGSNCGGTCAASPATPPTVKWQARKP